MFVETSESFIREQLGDIKYMIVTDSTVGKLYRHKFSGMDFFDFPSGESSKSTETYLNLMNALQALNYTRNDCIVALGGGVVGDLAGFVASTYMRGMRFVQIPTTLLAMVDSSIGGKTGINHGKTKNGIGTFYEAEAIYWDLNYLKTLPIKELNSGMAEVIKYALGFEPALKTLIEAMDFSNGIKADNLERLKEIIHRCVLIKKSIIVGDLHDHNQRQLLNFGHTYGHAIESFYAYDKYTHGEAVAIGLSYKLRSAVETNRISMKIAQEWFELMMRFDLPTELETPEHICAILDHMHLDKKASSKKIKRIELEALGRLSRVETTYMELMRMHGCNSQLKKALIAPKLLKGKIQVISSKSLAHRAIIASSLSKTPSHVGPIELSEDMTATLEAMRTYGACVEALGDRRYRMCWKGGIKAPIQIDCKESGSTLRFLIPFSFLTEAPVTFIGQGKLVERPLDPYYDLFQQKGVSYESSQGNLPLTVKGVLSPGIFELPGNISSQFVTGLLMALPLLKDPSTLNITSPLESKEYVALTLDVLAHYGIVIYKSAENVFEIPGNQVYNGLDYKVEGDYSQAAFWLGANQLGAKIELENLNLDSHQGDRAIHKWLDVISMSPHREVDLSQCPDLLPILSVVAALTRGTTRFVKGSRVRLKESDRIHAMAVELKKLGADLIETEDGLLVEGKDFLKGGVVYAWNDHRVAMAMAIASMKCLEPVVIYGAEAVKKSYPGFWEDFSQIGGEVDVKHIGQAL